MLVRALSFAVLGIDAVPVEVETDITHGLPSYTVVGLPGGAVRESDDRIRAAVRNSGLPFPGRKVTVNLAPADLRKDGSLLDLPIALSVLSAEGALPGEALAGWVIAGELSLDGTVRPIRGALAQAILARNLRIPGVITPFDNGDEARLVPGIRVVAVRSLREAAAALTGEDPPADGADADPGGAKPKDTDAPPPERAPDLADVVGQPMARRALEIAAAGCHAMLLVGPPGCGKTMLAERLPGILPDLSASEALEATRVYGASGEPPWPRPLLRRPFRAPHPSITAAGLMGGGNPPRPGEVSFAHCGVLFLDEFSEFHTDVREALRQPVESGEIRISRSGHRFRFPCRFLLLAATNPCPCGNAGHPRKVCRCSPPLLDRFSRKFSGPLLDRIDLAVSVQPVRGRGVVRRGARRILRGGPAPGRSVPHDPGGAVRGARFPDERDRPLRYGGAVAGAHPGSGRVPHAGGGTALPVGEGDREGVPRGADDRRPRWRAPGSAPPRSRGSPVPPVRVRNTGGIHVRDDAPRRRDPPSSFAQVGSPDGRRPRGQDELRAAGVPPRDIPRGTRNLAGTTTGRVRAGRRCPRTPFRRSCGNRG